MLGPIGSEIWPFILGQNLVTAGALCRSWQLGKAHDDFLWSVVDPLVFDYDPMFDEDWRPGCGREYPTVVV